MMKFLAAAAFVSNFHHLIHVSFGTFQPRKTETQPNNEFVTHCVQFQRKYKNKSRRVYLFIDELLVNNRVRVSIDANESL